MIFYADMRFVIYPVVFMTKLFGNTVKKKPVRKPHSFCFMLPGRVSEPDICVERERMSSSLVSLVLESNSAKKKVCPAYGMSE